MIFEEGEEETEEERRGAFIKSMERSSIEGREEGRRGR